MQDTTPEHRLRAIAAWFRDGGINSARKGDFAYAAELRAQAAAYTHAIKIIQPDGWAEIAPEWYRLVSEQ